MDYIQIHLGLCYSTGHARSQVSYYYYTTLGSFADILSLIFGMNPIKALVYNFSTITAPTYSSVVTGKYNYPAAGIAIAFFLVLSSITMIPIYTVKGYKSEF